MNLESLFHLILETILDEIIRECIEFIFVSDGTKIFLNFTRNRPFMLKYPIGIQDFPKLREGNFVYIDKTAEIYKLLNQAGYYFFARPRRFGKSLLLSTLKSIFEGKQALFKGLWIENQIDWVARPVIHLSFSSIAYKQKGLEKALSDAIKRIAKDFQITLEEEFISQQFKELIEQLGQEKRVVILIDEYDKPLIDYLGSDTALKNLDILKDLFSIIKDMDPYIHFFLITGISKFSRVSIFSDLNNLNDLTADAQFANLVGISQTELMQYFEPVISEMAQEQTITVSDLVDKIKYWYNGYSWDGVNYVYNPFSLLHFFTKKTFGNYWFASGTPTFLVETIRRENILPESITTIQVLDFFFDKFDLEKLDIYALLFQTGYLTIKEKNTQFGLTSYTLSYPNNEVQLSFLYNLLEAFTFRKSAEVSQVLFVIVQYLNSKNIAGFIQQIKMLFADISYHLHPKKQYKTGDQQFSAWEGYFQAIIYVTLKFLGLHIECEVTKHQGRIDAVIHTPLYIYIVEFKLEGTAKEGIEQIKARNYQESYKGREKQIILLGISFSKALHNVKDWKAEELT